MNVQSSIVSILNVPLRGRTHISNLQEFPPVLRSLGIHNDVSKLLNDYKEFTEKIAKRGRGVAYIGIILAVILFIFGQSKFIDVINNGGGVDYSWILGVLAFSLSFLLALAGCCCASAKMKKSELKMRLKIIKGFNEKYKEMGLMIDHQINNPSSPEEDFVPSLELKLDTPKFDDFCRRNGIQSENAFVINNSYSTIFPGHLDLPPSYSEVVSQNKY